MPSPSKMTPFGAIKLATVASAFSAVLFAVIGVAVTTHMSFDFASTVPVSDIEEATADLLLALLGVVSFSTAIMGFVLPKVMFGKIPQSSTDEELSNKYLQIMAIRVAFFEAIAVFGLVALLVTGSLWALVFNVVSLGVLIAFFPTASSPEDLRKLLRDQT